MVASIVGLLYRICALISNGKEILSTNQFTSETSQDDFENLKIQIGDDFARLIAVTKADIKGSSTEVEEKLEVLDNVLNHFDKINKNKFYDSVSKDIEDIIGMVANG